MTLGKQILRISTFSIVPLSKMSLNHNHTQHNETQHNSRDFSIVRLSIKPCIMIFSIRIKSESQHNITVTLNMLIGTILTVAIEPSGIIQSVVMPSAVAPSFLTIIQNGTFSVPENLSTNTS